MNYKRWRGSRHTQRHPHSFSLSNRATKMERRDESKNARMRQGTVSVEMESSNGTTRRGRTIGRTFELREFHIWNGTRSAHLCERKNSTRSARPRLKLQIIYQFHWIQFVIDLFWIASIVCLRRASCKFVNRIIRTARASLVSITNHNVTVSPVQDKGANSSWDQ